MFSHAMFHPLLRRQRRAAHVLGVLAAQHLEGYADAALGGVEAGATRVARVDGGIDLHGQEAVAPADL